MATTAQKLLNATRVDPSIFKLRPDYRALLMVVENIPPGPSDASSEALLQDAESHAKDLVSKQAVTDIPHIADWRDAYKGFGAKPQKTRNSLEALTRRAVTPGGLPRVNRLTDIYNAISVKHQIPLGGEDLDKYDGPPSLIRATGKEEFLSNSPEGVLSELVAEGEPIWADNLGVTCRRWNWRQCPRTALTDETTTVLFVLDALKALSDENLEKAAEELETIFKGLSPEVKVARRMMTPPEDK